MANELFPGFLSDPRQYEQAEAYWRGQWQKIVDRAAPSTPWTSPWLKNAHSDGTPCRDGNPIFSAVCPARRMGVSIIQYSPESPDEIDLDCWTQSFGDESLPDSTRMLVVSCVLSDRTAPLVSDYLYDWVATGRAPNLDAPKALAGPYVGDVPMGEEPKVR